MQETKLSQDDYMRRSPLGRLLSWKWWFIMLVFVGLLAAALVIWRELHRAPTAPSVSLSFAAMAFAAQAMPDSAQAHHQSVGGAMRMYVMIGILILIAVITLVCLSVSLFAKNDKSVTTASDLLKTCIGFFIGVATSYFGAAP